MGDLDNKRISKSLLPPEAVITNTTNIDDQLNVNTVEISTPKKTVEGTFSDTLHAARTPDGLDAMDLNIVNLESSNDIRIDDRARSSPSFRVNIDVSKYFYNESFISF